jgi:hypothetical protein
MLGLEEDRMSTSRILTRLIIWDMKLQARENVSLHSAHDIDLLRIYLAAAGSRTGCSKQIL